MHDQYEPQTSDLTNLSGQKLLAKINDEMNAFAGYLDSLPWSHKPYEFVMRASQTDLKKTLLMERVLLPHNFFNADVIQSLPGFKKLDEACKKEDRNFCLRVLCLDRSGENPSIVLSITPGQPYKMSMVYARKAFEFKCIDLVPKKPAPSPQKKKWFPSLGR